MHDKNFVELFAKAFNEVAIPALEDMEKRLKEELASKEDVYRLEEKLEKVSDSPRGLPRGINYNNVSWFL